MEHTTSRIFMVEPTNFRMNEQTSVTNSFQSSSSLINYSADQILGEFKALVAKLEAAGVNVHIEKDIPERDTPDSIFPNNWVSFHNDGSVFLFPMLTENRRRERNLDFVLNVVKEHKSSMKLIKDYSYEEKLGNILEGTGSVVFDHINRIAYCAISERSSKDLFIRLCEEMEYTPLYFNAKTKDGRDIYHTNVLLSVGEKFAVVCTESITSESERNRVVSALQGFGKEIIEISNEQMNNFCANIIQLQNNDGERLIAMSQTAYNAFNKNQLETLEKHGSLIHSDISSIETWGGGSVRCMICENRLSITGESH